MIKVHNPEKLEKARDFRKRGFSYSEISKIVGVSKSTVSNWFSRESFSKKVRVSNEQKARRDNVRRIGLINKYRSRERQQRYLEAIKSAEVEYKHYKTSPLFLTGVSLYMAVGDISSSQIRLPSQRPDVHKKFQSFLREFLGAEKQKIYHKNGVTILNEALSKKKLLTWIDQIR